jgi:hypothetical protein
MLRQEYRRRARETGFSFYSPTKPVNVFFTQQRTRHAIALLERERFFPLENRRILDGAGGWLADFEAWGARRGNLAGIDLDEARVAAAQHLLCSHRDVQGWLLAPAADIRLGDAANPPWPDSCFDLVLQSTVFTSILDSVTGKAARSMLNSQRMRQEYRRRPRAGVRGVGRATWLGALILEKLRFLSTHYLGVIRKKQP